MPQTTNLTSNTVQNNINNNFNPNSDGYKFLLQVSKGQLNELKKNFPLKKNIVNSLQPVSSKGDFYHSTHYAVSKEQWAMAAFLLNEGMNWEIVSKPGNGKTGKTAMSMLGRKNQGLSKLIQALIQNPDPINIE
nr:hypothetical protein [Chlamydiota bacterium]